MRTSREACERGIAPSSTDFIPFLPDHTTVKHVRLARLPILPVITMDTWWGMGLVCARCGAMLIHMHSVNITGRLSVHTKGFLQIPHG
jgi:hypothetical protein